MVAHYDRPSSPKFSRLFRSLQIQYQREIDRLEQENKDLRKRLMLRKESVAETRVSRRIRRSPIGAYSAVSLSVQHLPDFTAASPRAIRVAGLKL